MEIKMTDEKHGKKFSPAIKVHPDLMMGSPPQPSAAMPEPEAAAPEETSVGVVASGHSVHVNTGEKIACGYDAVLSRTVFRSAFVVVGPGEQVTLPKSEIQKLMTAGFLVDPDRIDTTTH
jgi:hypothetical protein